MDSSRTSDEAEWAESEEARSFARLKARLLRLPRPTPEEKQARIEAWREEYRREIEDAQARGGLDVPRKLRQLGVPPRLLDGLNAAQEPRPGLLRAKSWDAEWVAKRERPFLLLLGRSDAGKSHAAAWVFAEAVKRYPWNRQATGTEMTPFRWVDGGELEGVGRFGDGAEWIEKVSECAFLVLDDIGGEKDTKMQDAVALVERIIRARHNASRRTVITSNMTGEAFKARYDERVARRIRDAGWVVDCNYDAKALKAQMREVKR